MPPRSYRPLQDASCVSWRANLPNWPSRMTRERGLHCANPTLPMQEEGSQHPWLPDHTAQGGWTPRMVLKQSMVMPLRESLHHLPASRPTRDTWPIHATREPTRAARAKAWEYDPTESHRTGKFRPSEPRRIRPGQKGCPNTLMALKREGQTTAAPD